MRKERKDKSRGGYILKERREKRRKTKPIGKCKSGRGVREKPGWKVEKGDIGEGTM